MQKTYHPVFRHATVRQNVHLIDEILWYSYL